MTDLLRDFEQHLPHAPFCTDDSENGLKIRRKRFAIKKRLIQFNPPSMVHWIVLDIDHPGVLERISDQTLPPPNILCINPSNGHAHALFRLEAPVCTSERGRRKPQALLDRVIKALISAYDADASYRQFICKNPLHEAWTTLTLRRAHWGLNEFWDWIEPCKHKPQTQVNSGSLSASDEVFNAVRRWAYDRNTKGQAPTLVEAQDRAAQHNITNRLGLTKRTTNSIGRSIHDWVRKHHTGAGMPSPEVSKEQRARAQKSLGRPKVKGIQRGLGVPRWRSTEAQRQEAYGALRVTRSSRRSGAK